MEGKWDERFGLDSKSQGTGMALDDAVALRIGDISAFCTYMGQVWKESQAYLDTIGDEDLPRSMTIRPLGEMTLEQVLGTTLLTHGYSHLGEIWLLKGLQASREALCDTACVSLMMKIQDKYRERPQTGAACAGRSMYLLYVPYRAFPKCLLPWREKVGMRGTSSHHPHPSPLPSREGL